MNERIRSLARQSHLDVYGLGLDKVKWEAVLGQFAESIVRECADIATMNQYQPLTAGTYVLKHFGVE